MKKKVETPEQNFLTIFINNRKFQRELEKSRKTYLKNVKTHKVNGKSVVYARNVGVLQNEVSKLMDMYGNLPEAWEDSFREAIETGNLIPPKSSTAPKVNFEQYLPTGRSKIIVHIFKRTTKTEYIKAWEEVKERQKRMVELRPQRISARDLRILRKYEKGKNDALISAEMAGDIRTTTVRKVVSRKARLLSISVTPKPSRTLGQAKR